MLFSEVARLVKEKYPDTKSDSPLDCELSSVEFCETYEIVPPVDSLCIFTAKMILSETVLPLCFVCVGTPDQNAYEKILYSGCNYILIPQTSSTEATYYIMCLFGSTLKQQRLYSDLTYMMLSGADLASVFCEFAKGSGCQMLAIDISGKVLAYSKPFMIDHPHWMHSIEVGFLDSYLIEYILSYRVKNNMDMSPNPFVLFCNRLQMHIKVIRVIDHNDIIGYVFMGNYTGEFPSFSDKFMHLLARNVYTKLLGSRSYSTYRVNMHQSVLSDIIDGASEEETVQRIRVAKLSFPTNMRAIVFRPGYFRGNEYLYDTLMPEVMSILPDSPKILKRNTIVTILDVDESGEIQSEVLDALTTLASKNQVLIGVSNTFHKPSQFAMYYQQALQTISFSKCLTNICGLYYFSDYAFFIMLDSVEDKSVLEQCRHHVLSDLEKYDEEKNTELYKTLRIYTQTGFSKNRTAEQLFMHRNTVNYRIQQIENMFMLDFTDPSLMFKLQYSFYIDAFLNKRFADLSPPKENIQLLSG